MDIKYEKLNINKASIRKKEVNAITDLWIKDGITYQTEETIFLWLFFLLLIELNKFVFI